MRLTERFTRIDPEMIDYEATIDDPVSYTRPWTIRTTITTQPDYQPYEYACHEGKRRGEVRVERRARVRKGRGGGGGQRAADPEAGHWKPVRSAGRRHGPGENRQRTIAAKLASYAGTRVAAPLRGASSRRATLPRSP